MTADLLYDKNTSVRERSPVFLGNFLVFGHPIPKEKVLAYLVFKHGQKNMSQKENTLLLTPEGLNKIKEELRDLIENKRPEVAKRIQDAREAGDISENSEYDAAKQEQSYVEGRISELEDIVKNAKISEIRTNDEVGVGCKVTVHMESSEDTFYIVGAPEADPMAKKISDESPLGSALLGKRVGEQVEFEAPVGKLVYTILKIEY